MDKVIIAIIAITALGCASVLPLATIVDANADVDKDADVDADADTDANTDADKDADKDAAKDADANNEPGVFSGFFILSKEDKIELIDMDTANSIYNYKIPTKSCHKNMTIALEEEHDMTFMKEERVAAFSKIGEGYYFNSKANGGNIYNVKPIYIGNDTYSGCHISGRLMAVVDEKEFVEILLDEAGIDW